MLDINDDGYIEEDELTEFYKSYLATVQSIEANRVPSIIEALLNRFSLTTVSLGKY